MDGRAINEYGVVKIDAAPVVYLTPVRLAGDGQDPGQWPGVEPFGRGEASPTPYKFPLWHSNGVSYFTGEKEAGMRTLFSCLTGRTPDSAGQPVPGLRDSVRTRARSLRSLYTQM